MFYRSSASFSMNSLYREGNTKAAQIWNKLVLKSNEYINDDGRLETVDDDNNHWVTLDSDDGMNKS